MTDGKSHSMDWDKITAELRKPLDPSAVNPPPKGKFGEYVDGLHVIREANRIFGENGWSYEVTRLQMVSEQTVTLKGGNGEYEQYRVGYLCSVRVTIDGVVREGCAVGNGAGNPNTMADQHESAVKEAETDALKRALRCFGNTFGLALYEKDKNKREVGKPEADRDPRKVADSLIAVVREASNYGHINEIISGQKFDAAWKWLDEEHKPMGLEVKKAVAEMRDKFDPSGQAPDERAA